MKRLLPALLGMALYAVIPPAAAKPAILDHSLLKDYVTRFNADDEEMFSNIKNKDAYAFLENNIPLFDCPDEDFRRTYYFRWWMYRKHVKKTEDGYVVTEFMPPSAGRASTTPSAAQQRTTSTRGAGCTTRR